jgi:hypothetical protein
VPGWDTFAVIIGGAAGALVGLLFVSVSIRIEVISASPDFRSRAGETLSLFMTVLLVAVLLAIPDQRPWEFGVELLVLAVAWRAPGCSSRGSPRDATTGWPNSRRSFARQVISSPRTPGR